VENINIEDEFTYLGTVCMSNGSFCKNQSKLVGQGRKATYSILKKCRNLKIWYCFDNTLTVYQLANKGNNKITELRTILQRESPNS
jgi:hypothetical protein